MVFENDRRGISCYVTGRSFDGYAAWPKQKKSGAYGKDADKSIGNIFFILSMRVRISQIRITAKSRLRSGQLHFICRSSTRFRKMTPGGVKASPNGQTQKNVRPDFRDITSRAGRIRTSGFMTCVHRRRCRGRSNLRGSINYTGFVFIIIGFPERH